MLSKHWKVTPHLASMCGKYLNDVNQYACPNWICRPELRVFWNWHVTSSHMEICIQPCIIKLCCIHSCTLFHCTHVCGWLAQVWKDRHQAVARDVIDATAKKISLGIPHQLNGRKMSLVSQSSRSPESSPVRVESEQAVS